MRPENNKGRRGKKVSSEPNMNEDLRESIIARPDVILEDQDLMRALIAANERAMGNNIVDLRGIAMDRLEARLERLEDTHRSVIAAAYDNLAGTNQVHRAILQLLNPVDFEAFLKNLGVEVATTLRVDRVKLVLETVQREEEAAVKRLGDVLTVAEPGFIETYLHNSTNASLRQVTLRQIRSGDWRIYGRDSEFMRSEACLLLDFGKQRLPGMLVLGAEDPHQFSPQQGTDLLEFFAGVFERAMRRWLS